jgi:hypothetical protein
VGRLQLLGRRLLLQLVRLLALSYEDLPDPRHPALALARHQVEALTMALARLARPDQLHCRALARALPHHHEPRLGARPRGHLHEPLLSADERPRHLSAGLRHRRSVVLLPARPWRSGLLLLLGDKLLGRPLLQLVLVVLLVRPGVLPGVHRVRALHSDGNEQQKFD